MNYRGVLTDAGGDLVPNGSYSLNFRMYTTPDAGKAIWSETQKVQITDGIFNVNLGEVVPLSAKFDRPYWLGIGVNGELELTPRIQLTASAYSLNARSVSDSSITTSKITDGTVTLPKINSSGAVTGEVMTYNGVGLEWKSPAGGIGGSGVVNYIPRFLEPNTLSYSNISYDSEFSGSIGIGASPAGANSKLLISHFIAKGVATPSYLARFQTATFSGAIDRAYIKSDGSAYFKGSLESEGDAYFKGSLKVGSSSITIAEIRQLTGITSSSTFTYVYLPTDWYGDNTRILSVEVYIASVSFWRPVSFGSYTDDLYYQLFQTYIRIKQDTDDYTNLSYRIVMMRIE